MSDPLKFVVQNAVEQESGVYRAVLKDENGVAVNSNVLTQFLLTLYAMPNQAIVNNRSAQNALNANNVTVDVNGNVTWIWLPADMTILNPNLPVEEHVALFEAKWLDSQSNPRQLNHEVRFQVNRIPKLA